MRGGLAPGSSLSRNLPRETPENRATQHTSRMFRRGTTALAQDQKQPGVHSLNKLGYVHVTHYEAANNKMGTQLHPCGIPSQKAHVSPAVTVKNKINWATSKRSRSCHPRGAARNRSPLIPWQCVHGHPHRPKHSALNNPLRRGQASRRSGFRLKGKDIRQN